MATRRGTVLLLGMFGEPVNEWRRGLSRFTGFVSRKRGFHIRRAIATLAPHRARTMTAGLLRVASCEIIASELAHAWHRRAPHAAAAESVARGDSRVSEYVRHLVTLTLLSLALASCSSPHKSNDQAEDQLNAGALVHVRYAPGARYGDLSIRPVVVLDDGSGERVITAEELLFPYRYPRGSREMRTSGAVSLRVLLLTADGGDTLARATARLPLEPDLVLDVTVSPGLQVDEVVAPHGRLDPRTHVAAAISKPGGGFSGDSLYVLWVSRRRSDRSVS
jgi:hypothetical protein